MNRLRAAIPILPVDSLSAAVDFYGRLGFTAKLYSGADAYAFLQRDGQELHLRQAAELTPENPSGVYFLLESDNAAELEAEFREAGAEILSPLSAREWGMNEFVLADPDGNLLRFGEPLPGAPSA